MNIILPKLIAAITASGYSVKESDLIPLVRKLILLKKTGRFSKLLSSLLTTNDKANLHSQILEATFAYQFEASGKPLNYEVRCRTDDETTIDFHRSIPSGISLYMEMRQVRQQQVITDLFEEQLRHSNRCEVLLGREEDQKDTLRLLRLILSKAQDPKGKLIKFSRCEVNDYNIIVVEVSELHLGMIDHYDCNLVTYGDPSVPDSARRQIFGLFQEDRDEYPDYINQIAAQYSTFRMTIHGVMFLRKYLHGNPFNFELEFYLIPNKNLITDDIGLEIAEDLRGAMAPWKEEN